MLVEYRKSFQMIMGAQQPLRLCSNPKLCIRYMEDATVITSCHESCNSFMIWSEEVCVMARTHS